LIAGLRVSDCIELCDISQRTWYRWMAHGAPRWAIRLILSQCGTLDRFGWKHWEIRRGALYCNELHHRYYWEPVRLLLPLYGVTDPALPHSGPADNVSSLVAQSKRREVEKSPDLQAQPPSASRSNCA
jgi:hypothetical protein